MQSTGNYKREQPTTSCYLDGRYIALVLKDVSEFNPSPIHVHIKIESDLQVTSSNIYGSLISLDEGMNIFRLVIVTPEVSHSALLWIDTRDKTMIFTDVRDERDNTPQLVKRDNILRELLQSFFSDLDFEYSTDIAYLDMKMKQGCTQSGYCNAYVIKQVLDYKAEKDFDPSDIERFAAAIEKKYKHLLDPNSGPEVEYRNGRGGYHGGDRGYRGGYYGGYGGAGLGLGVGLLGGVALGAALAPPYPVYYPQPYPYPYPYY